MNCKLERLVRLKRCDTLLETMGMNPVRKEQRCECISKVTSSKTG